MFKGLPGMLRKLLPTIVLVVLAILAGATDVFSIHVHGLVSKMFQDYVVKLIPFGVNLLIGAIVINVAYLMYYPVREGLSRALQSGGASERGKNLAMKALQLGYWGLATFFALTIVAPDVLSKVFLGSSLLIAAVTLAVQGALSDFVYGVALQFNPRFKLNDEIEVVGKNAKGKVIDIGYLATQLEASDGRFYVPNRDVWGNSVKVVKPEKPKSPIILPPGVSVDNAADEGKK